MIHPGNATYPTIDTLAVDVLDIKFYGKSAHASENADEALNALDAMISYFNGVAQLRQHIKKSTRTWCYLRRRKSCKYYTRFYMLDSIHVQPLEKN